MNEELIISLENKCTLRCFYGDHVRICDPNGNEILYWDSNEWAEDPVSVMGAIFSYSLTPLSQLLENRVLSDGIWDLVPKGK